MKAKRLLTLPPYLFEELERRCLEAENQGRDVIDLSIGDPDLPPPVSLVSNLETALLEDRHHRYPPQRGAPELKASIRRYLYRRCGVEPADDQILVLVGSKEGIAHLPLAVCNPGETVLVPDPGYPVYTSSAQFAGCTAAHFALRESNGYLPDFEGMRSRDRSSARLLFLNYPNNPTGAVAPGVVFDEALRFGKATGAVVANDAAYADVYFGGDPVPLLCARDGALDLPTIEFFSFSKTFCITGWRIGFAVGRSDVIEALAHLKANVDSGVFGAIQAAAAVTLDTDGDRYAESMRATFGKRREMTLAALEKLHFHCFSSCATFYVWVRVPSADDPRGVRGAENAMGYALHLLEKTDVLVTPGTGFGGGGEGYCRMAVPQPGARIYVAVARIAAL
ncbi:MAG: aminotransferase class I/II-fold pyridoxal phosphate-dependent enzyme [bacterium]